MTRQWLADPSQMCRQHLLGEHAETHSFLRKMEKGYSLKGFREGSMFFGADFLLFRHDLLSSYIAGHKTPLVISPQVREAYPLIMPIRKDVVKSMSDLLGRCMTCKENSVG